MFKSTIICQVLFSKPAQRARVFCCFLAFANFWRREEYVEFLKLRHRGLWSRCNPSTESLFEAPFNGRPAQSRLLSDWRLQNNQHIAVYQTYWLILVIFSLALKPEVSSPSAWHNLGINLRFQNILDDLRQLMAKARAWYRSASLSEPGVTGSFARHRRFTDLAATGQPHWQRKNGQDNTKRSHET